MSFATPCSSNRPAPIGIVSLTGQYWMPHSVNECSPNWMESSANLALVQTIVPMKIYFNDRGRAKVELALARGKEGRDRRREIADRDVRREVEREFKGRMR